MFRTYVVYVCARGMRVCCAMYERFVMNCCMYVMLCVSVLIASNVMYLYCRCCYPFMYVCYV